MVAHFFNMLICFNMFVSIYQHSYPKDDLQSCHVYHCKPYRQPSIFSILSILLPFFPTYFTLLNYPLHPILSPQLPTIPTFHPSINPCLYSIPLPTPINITILNIQTKQCWTPKNPHIVLYLTPIPYPTTSPNTNLRYYIDNHSHSFSNGYTLTNTLSTIYSNWPK